MPTPAPHILTDQLTRRLYSTDASMYEQLPAGVALPRDEEELRQTLLEAWKAGHPVTMRAAGTSLAGQTTGGGVVIDLSRHFNRILELDPTHRRARVQPGVIRDTLNREAARHGLLFGPDTSTTNRCMLGGMIGNNSSGSFSLKYRTTREHVLELDTILSDGSRAVFRPLTPEELQEKLARQDAEGKIYRGMLELLTRNKEWIQDHYPHPEIIRRNTGYALDRLCEMDPITPGGRPFNLAELLCGSEGTLAITTSAVVNLEPLPRHTLVMISQFESVGDSMHATVEIVRHGPSAVELIDDKVIGATEGNLEQRENRFFLKGSPKAVLITQFEGDDPGELRNAAQAAMKALQDQGLGYDHDVFADEERKRRVWDLRKAGLGLLMGLAKDSKTPTFTEDTAVRVQDLPAYIEDFQELLRSYGTDSVFYAHASVGEIHLRPILDLYKPGDRQRMESMALDVARLVRRYRGSLSGEHGDGRARSPFIRELIGEEGVKILGEVKRLWDPEGRLNPGKIVDPRPMTEDLRAPVSAANVGETAFHWRKEGGFENAISLCNGAGVCRKLALSGGVMCPSYHATREERDSTRGRANLFRQLFTGEDPEGFQSEDLGKALSLCLSCKGCKSECPANVDMARMKAEYQNARHRRDGIPLRKRFFGEPARAYGLATRFPWAANRVLGLSSTKYVLEKAVGVDRSRTLPRFASQTFLEWLGREHPKALLSKADLLADAPPSPTPDAPRSLVLAVDLFSNVHEPDIARKAFQVLSRLGWNVLVPGVVESGRTRISQGMLDSMGPVIRKAVSTLASPALRELPIIGLEPSEILTFRDELLDLCDDADLPTMRQIAARSHTLEEFLQMMIRQEHLPAPSQSAGSLALHTHCHYKVLGRQDAVQEVLRWAGYQVETIASGCCGMAGSFGYETQSVQVSREIGELRLMPAIRSLEKGTQVCAHGFSCRHQIEDATGMSAAHTVHYLWKALCDTPQA